MAKGETAMDTRQAGMMGLGNWPCGKDGKPMALIGFQMSELIGPPNFSNVTVGPAFVMRFVPDVGDAEPETLKEGFKITIDDVESIMREQREVILNIVKKATA